MPEKPFEKMAEEMPKASAPTEAAAPNKEEQDLPKLSPQEFRIYNRLAEHMDMFVSLTAFCPVAKKIYVLTYLLRL